MSILMGNLASKISCNLQSRFFSIPWGRRNTAILCLKGRDCTSSSVPVRYIPKKSSKISEAENSLPTTGSKKRVSNRSLDDVKRTFYINDKPQNQKQKQTCEDSLLVDCEQVKQDGQGITAFSKLEEEINHELGHINHELIVDPKKVIEKLGIQQEEDATEKKTHASKIVQDAEKAAVKLLAARAYTAAGLTKKLCQKKFPPDVVKPLITDFQSRGLINDSLYAEIYSRSRWSSFSWGPTWIKQALSQKGVSKDDAEKAVKLVFEDGDGGDNESQHGLSKPSMDHLLVQASKQWLRSQNAPIETRKSRIVRWLQYRGFNWGVISSILRKLESQYPASAP